MSNYSMSPVYLRDQAQDGSILAIGELVKRSNTTGRTRATAGVVDGIVCHLYNGKIQVCVGGLAQNPNGPALTYSPAGSPVNLPGVDGDTLYQDTTTPHLIATTGNVSVGKKYAGAMGAGYAEGLLFEPGEYLNKIYRSSYGPRSYTLASPAVIGRGLGDKSLWVQDLPAIPVVSIPFPAPLGQERRIQGRYRTDMSVYNPIGIGDIGLEVDSSDQAAFQSLPFQGGQLKSFGRVGSDFNMSYKSNITSRLLITTIVGNNIYMPGGSVNLSAAEVQYKIYLSKL